MHLEVHQSIWLKSQFTDLRTKKNKKPVGHSHCSLGSHYLHKNAENEYSDFLINGIVCSSNIQQETCTEKMHAKEPQ